MRLSSFVWLLALQMKQLLPLPHLMVEGVERGNPAVANFEPLLSFLWVSQNTQRKAFVVLCLPKALNLQDY